MVITVLVIITIRPNIWSGESLSRSINVIVATNSLRHYPLLLVKWTSMDWSVKRLLWSPTLIYWPPIIIIIPIAIIKITNIVNGGWYFCGGCGLLVISFGNIYNSIVGHCVFDNCSGQRYLWIENRMRRFNHVQRCQLGRYIIFSLAFLTFLSGNVTQSHGDENGYS